MTIEELENLREQRGKEIAHKESQVTRIEETLYTVRSQTGNGEYAVSQVDHEWVCECPDNKFRSVKCKHVFAVEFSIALRNAVGQVRIEPIVNLQVCQICGSNKVVKDGLRHNKYGDIQVYYCKSCGEHFTINLGFERMKSTPQIITSALQLYFSGTSLRKCAEFLKLQGVKVSYVAVYKWINKYVALMDKYIEKLTPQVSGTWRADELWLKIKGDKKYLFAIMDDETRYWIAQEVAGSKYKHDARKLFHLAKKVTGKKPETIITDGLPAYHDAYKKEFWTLKNPRTKHVNAIKFRGDMNNNKMERFNGEVRDREKVIRGLKKDDTPILKGYQLFHNFIRPHEALDGKTPADACGLKVEGQNKWITLIQNASQKNP
jgi:transposase-like protein/predicted SprT family Zn-dependent metalloprotease